MIANDLALLDRGPLPRPFDPPFPDIFRRPPQIFEWDRPAKLNIRYGPAHINVLVVSDGNSYDPNPNDGFSLGIALQDAFDPGHPEHPSYARFTFTKAHRTTDTGVTPGFENFRFNAGSLDDFHEVWLFGFNSNAPYLSAAELDVLHAFMDSGGGVLAMGDHEDLGLGLCGGVKRVRSMRKWWHVSPPPPAGMLQAPDGVDLTRNDTQQPAFTGGPANGGSEADDHPQTIFPNYRYGRRFWRPWQRYKYPHPLLCGPRGAIRVMPDHPHEGDCIMPDPAFAGEYPGGVPVEIIARGRNAVGRTKGGFTITDPREFGLIGVWNGHDPDSGGDYGRVVVDSTWHHWFNINLRGLRIENGDEYKDILAYFRNVAVWLAPKERQARMRKSGQLIIMVLPEMIEITATLKTLRPEIFYPLGIEARDALGRIAPRCQSAAWWWDIIVATKVSPSILKAIEAFDEEEHVDLLQSAAVDLVTTTLFGAVVNAVAVRINEVGLDALEKIQDELDEIAARGARSGLDVARKALARSQRKLSPFLDRERELEAAE